MIYFEQVIECVIGGFECKFFVFDFEEKRIVVYYEVGYVVCGWYFWWVDFFFKVFIIFCGQGVFGYVQYFFVIDVYFMLINQFMDCMVMIFGGCVFEEFYFFIVIIGVFDDFKKVIYMVIIMVI